MPSFKYEDGVTISQDVLDFLEEVSQKSQGYDIYLGGGYIRDLYARTYGSTYAEDLEPKDVDVFVIPKEMGEHIPRKLHLPAKGYTNFIKEAWEIPDMEERGVKSVTGTWYKTLSTSNVQFIEYKEPMTMLELAADMDMTINQCMYSVERENFVFTQGFLDDHENEIIRCDHVYDTVRMYKRFVRMEDKFWWYDTVGKPDLDWEDLSRLAASVDHAGSFCESDEFDFEISNQTGKESWD